METVKIETLNGRKENERNSSNSSKNDIVDETTRTYLTEFQLIGKIRANVDRLFGLIDKFKQELIDDCSDIVQKQIAEFESMLNKSHSIHSTATIKSDQ